MTVLYDGMPYSTEECKIYTPTQLEGFKWFVFLQGCFAGAGFALVAVYLFFLYARPSLE